MSKSSSVGDSGSVLSESDDSSGAVSSLVNQSSVEVSSVVEIFHLSHGESSESISSQPGLTDGSGLLHESSDSVFLDSIVPLEALRSSVDSSPSETLTGSSQSTVFLVGSD